VPFSHSIVVNRRNLGSIGEGVGPEPDRTCTMFSAFQRPRLRRSNYDLGLPARRTLSELQTAHYAEQTSRPEALRRRISHDPQAEPPSVNPALIRLENQSQRRRVVVADASPLRPWRPPAQPAVNRPGLVGITPLKRRRLRDGFVPGRQRGKLLLRYYRSNY